MTQPNLGLSGTQVEVAVAILEKVLSDEVVLRTKLQKYHWNVVGAQFLPLHQLFEQQYDALAEVIDTVAERIRQFGAIAPGTLREFLDHARLTEAPGVNPTAEGMLAAIANDHEQMVRLLREDFATAETQVGDIGLEDLLTELLQMHQKQAWFVRAFLG